MMYRLGFLKKIIIFGFISVLPLTVLAVDSDADGLDDSVETNTGTYVSPTDTGTDPNNSDTDSDGALDGDEVLVHGSNPTLADTDSDGVNDGIEVSFGTDPLNALNNPIENKLWASDAAASDFFGWRVAVSGDTAVIGAYGEDDNGADAGAAYVYVRSASGMWTEQQKLTASDGAAAQNFGYSVATSGDKVVIGAPLANGAVGFSGAAYVYVRSGGVWAEQQVLNASDGAALDFFGWSVAVLANKVVVGAYGDDDNGSSSGSAYIYISTAGVWSEQQKLTASDGLVSDNFGWSVAISNNTAVVSARSGDGVVSDSGAVYVYTLANGSWSEQQKLTADDGAVLDFYGHSVSLSDDTVVVGAFRDDDNGTSSGSAYVYLRSGITWSSQAKLSASDGALDDFFGQNVSVSGDTILVGAYGDDDKGTDSGSAYVYVRRGNIWTEEQKFTASDGVASDSFGFAAALSGDIALIGTYLDDDSAANSGSAFVVDLDADNDGLLNSVETNTGTFVSASDSGTDPFVADSDGDAILDGIEVKIGFDPTIDDADNDGLTAAEELIQGTDALLADTDGDGISDGAEVADGWNPLLNDRDNDGLSASEEVGFDTNPLLADTDMDGVLDGQEIIDGSDPLVANGLAKSVPVAPLWSYLLMIGLGLITYMQKAKRTAGANRR